MLGTAACGGGAGSGGTTAFKVALGWITDVEFAGFFLAADRGYYRDEGLAVTFKGGGTNTPLPHVQLASGAVDLTVDPNMRQVLEVIGQGNDLVMLGAQFQTDPNGLLSLAKRPVRTAADLKGLRILSQQGTQPLLNGLYKANGLPPDFEFIPTGFDPGALVQGQGDAYNCFVTNQPIILEEQFGLKRGSGYEVVTYSELGCPAYANVICCKRSLVQEKRDQVVRFMRASARGWQDNAADPDAAAKLVIQKYGVDLGLNEKQQARQNQLQVPLTESTLTKANGILRMDPGVVESTMYTWLRLAGASSLPDPRHVIDTSILADVFKNGARL
ncbi:ABC-type nitrate/sulfonate/bicarbonate transport system substrate-binding protein [Actinocrispum wychmicini]|uniref:Thiamine pyrimidine synthase n=2 Tax=Actinocrispum wychmicini TaxID=1213861 RepID=A0A4R2JI58_9PSEU|nr:ABC-type nitrate/sulfonate/bicarbonate transport system substrate-binding protein [Actinocrispum wychmicini]